MTIRLISNTAVVICLALASFSCSKSNSWDDSTTKSSDSKTYNNAEEAIADMAKIDWVSSDIYNQVHDMEISDRKSLKETDRHALHGSLEEAYAKQLVRTCQNIMSSSCSSRHATLHAAYKELHNHDFKGYKPDGLQAVEDAYKLHNEQLKFSVASNYGVGLSSFLDSYNSTYDSQKRAEAQKIRATNPTCQEIKNKVSEAHVNDVLAQRKQNYYAALASKFCRSSDPSIGDYNRLRSLLQGARNYTALINKIEAHWDKLQESNNSDY